MVVWFLCAVLDIANVCRHFLNLNPAAPYLLHGHDPLPEVQETIDGDGEFAASTVEELEEQLTQAIDNEDYELASKIRDEIGKRSK